MRKNIIIFSLFFNNLPVLRRKNVKFVTILSAIFLFVISISAQNLSGSYTLQLQGPASSEQIDHAKTAARMMLKTNIINWLKTVHGFKIDTSSALVNFYVDVLTDSCLNRSKIESAYKGKKLTFIYSLTDSAAEKSFDIVDKAMEDNAIKAWNSVKKAQTENNFTLLFESSIKACCYSSSHLAEPIPTPGDSGVTLAYNAQQNLQMLFNRIKIQSSGMILQGKIGRAVENPPIITVLIDSIPLSHFWFSGQLQSGKPEFSVCSDDQGQISLKDLIIPIVANGTLLSLTPDIGKPIGAASSINCKDINIQLKDGQIQTFMYKVTRPTFSLDYKASYSDTSIKLPADFSSPATLKNYLRDSCFFADAQPGFPPDFIITLESAISNSATDITEENGLKMNAVLTIKGLSLVNPKTEKKNIKFVKLYGKLTATPYGLFIWDMNNVLKQNIRSTLNKF